MILLCCTMKLLLLLFWILVKSSKQASLTKMSDFPLPQTGTPLPITQQQAGPSVVNARQTGVHEIPFRDFLDQKPSRMEKAKGQKYMFDFAKRPEVTEINFQDTNTKAIVQRVLALEEKVDGRIQRLKLSTLIDRYCRVNLARCRLLAELRGVRYRRRKEAGNLIYKEKLRKANLAGYLAKRKEYQDKSYRNRRKKERPPSLNALLKETVDTRKLSAIEMAKKALMYKDLYERPNDFTWALKAYLAQNFHSKEDIKIASGWAALQLQSQRRIQRMGRRAKNVRNLDNLEDPIDGIQQIEEPIKKTSKSKNSFLEPTSMDTYIVRLNVGNRIQPEMIDEYSILNKSNQRSGSTLQKKVQARYVDKVLGKTDWWHSRHF